MFIGSSARLNNIDSIVISAENKPLEEVNSLPYLTTVINKNFTWNDHVDHIRSKIQGIC